MAEGRKGSDLYLAHVRFKKKKTKTWIPRPSRGMTRGGAVDSTEELGISLRGTLTKTMQE